MQTKTIGWILGLALAAGGALPALAKDTTPPAITASVTGTLGANGWYTSNVGIAWTVTDAESRISKKTGCGTSSVTTDTAGATYTCTATSTGGTATQSVTVKRDATRFGAACMQGAAMAPFSRW